RFQACRYGFAGVLTDVHTGEQVTIGEDIQRLLDKIAPYADKLNGSSALEAVAQFVRRGKSEDQLMRDFVADGGSLIGLVQKHAEIWAAQ
ncbi:MAG TPA: glutamate--cysteine ligase, partial [Enterobacteriaceae bacterium]|nr:glutamate--cysteine ligase [Enterobacteriaceae bacterium]